MNFWRFLSCRQTAIRLTHYAIEIDKETKHWFTFRCMSNSTSPQSEKNNDSKHGSNTPKILFCSWPRDCFCLYFTLIRHIHVYPLSLSQYTTGILTIILERDCTQTVGMYPHMPMNHLSLVFVAHVSKFDLMYTFLTKYQ